MTNVMIKYDQISDELRELLAQIEKGPKTTCDLPGCEKSHRTMYDIRVALPRPVDLYFCSAEHRDLAPEKLGFPQST